MRSSTRMEYRIADNTRRLHWQTPRFTESIHHQAVGGPTLIFNDLLHLFYFRS